MTALLIASSSDVVTLIGLGVLLLFAFALSALYSGSETGVYAVNRLRLELRCEDPDDGIARSLQGLLDSRELVLCVLLLGNNIANEAAAMLGEHLLGHWFSGVGAALATTLILTPVMFLVAEALPKHLFRQHAEVWTYRMTRFLVASRWAFRPLTFLVLPVARFARRWAASRGESGMRGLRHDEYALERLLVSGDSSIESVRDVAMRIGVSRSRPVQEAMVAFGQMNWLAASDPVEALQARLGDSAHTRYPLRDEDGAFTNYVYFLDPFLKDRAAEGACLGDFGRPLVLLRPDQLLDEALAKLESTGSRVGVVTSRQGETLGFLFASDVVGSLLSLDNVEDRKPGATKE